MLRVPSVWERVSPATCVQIAQLDAPTLSSDVEDYVKRNEVTYYALINVWLWKWAEIDRSAEYLLLSEMTKRGLIEVISSLDDDASVICEHVNDSFTPNGLSPFAERLLGKVEDTRLALELLRFPKRFSPLCADKLQKETIEQWLETNRAAREFTLPILADSMSQCIREAIEETIPICLHDRMVFSTGDTPAGSIARRWQLDFESDDWVTKYWYLNDDRGDGYDFYVRHLENSGEFPWKINSGANFEGIPSIFSERAAALLPLLLAEGVLGAAGDTLLCYSDPLDDPRFNCWCDRLVPVPKNYKKARIVAPQPIVCNTVLYRAQADLRGEVRRKNLPIFYRDQLPNQEAAFEGSMTGNYATLDMSNASDSIPKVVVEYMFPTMWVQAVEPWIPQYSLLPDGRKVRHGMWATSGSVITFPTETNWFFGVCEGVRRYMKAFYPRTRFLRSIVYGDDINVDVRLAETVIDVLRKFGQTVNIGKSYYSKAYKYRESCGVEYYKGIPLDTHYWPRNTMDFGKDSVTAIASLIALQHRFFYEEGVANFLYCLVKGLKPSMTSSIPGTPCTDLWEVGISTTTKSRVWGPKALDGTKLDGEETISELHQCLVTSKVGTPDYSHRYDGIGEFLIYQRYLHDGPMYSTPLDELLGVSTSRRPMNFSQEVGPKWQLQ